MVCTGSDRARGGDAETGKKAISQQRSSRRGPTTNREMGMDPMVSVDGLLEDPHNLD